MKQYIVIFIIGIHATIIAQQEKPLQLIESTLRNVNQEIQSKGKTKFISFLAKPGAQKAVAPLEDKALATAQQMLTETKQFLIKIDATKNKQVARKLIQKRIAQQEKALKHLNRQIAVYQKQIKKIKLSAPHTTKNVAKLSQMISEELKRPRTKKLIDAYSLAVGKQKYITGTIKWFKQKAQELA